MSHPIGIQPWGNYFLKDNKEEIRKSSLGKISKLTDEMILEILAYLKSEEIGRIACLSKAWYCFSYFEDIWKSKVLEEFEGNFKFNKTWRHTYLYNKYKISYKPYPIKISGFYSDILYTPWFYSNFHIPKSWLKNNNIKRIKIDNLNEDINVPVIITDVVKNWPAYKKWSRQYLEEVFKDKNTIVGNYSMSFTNYINYLNEQNDDMPLYLFDKNFVTTCSQLEKDYYVPDYFKNDLFSILKEKRPDYRWLIMGPKRSGSSFHIDPNATSAWNAVIKGSKKWIFYPPNGMITPPGVHMNEIRTEVATPISLIEWFLNFYQEFKDSEIGMECILNEGELLFIPSGWWHLALNLEETIAITQNFVPRHNLKYVLDFLKSKNSDLVSGVPLIDRKNLYDEFLKCLKDNESELLKNIDIDIGIGIEGKKFEDKTNEKPFKFDFVIET